MAQPEPVATAATGAVWSQQPARRWPHKTREGGGGEGLAGASSRGSLTPGRRFMGLLTTQWMHWGEWRDLSVPTCPRGPLGAGWRGKEALSPGSPSRPRAVGEALPPLGVPRPLCPPHQEAAPVLTAASKSHV